MQCCSKNKIKTFFHQTYRFIAPSANEYCLHKYILDFHVVSNIKQSTFDYSATLKIVNGVYLASSIRFIGILDNCVEKIWS